jgi:cytosine/adenosine deaminase-related metal-dependent hydrolase
LEAGAGGGILISTMSAPWSVTARWVFPVDSPPLERGVVVVQGERIQTVEPRGRRTADLDLGNAALLPGLVNAHTHLDLSGLRGQAPPTPDFPRWLKAVVRHRRGQTREQVEQDVRVGLAECLARGTTLVGDVSGQGLSWPVLAEAPLRAVVFHEILGLPPERARLAWDGFRAWLRTHPATPTCRPGVSPHAPYSVRAALFRTAASFARRHHLPVTTHLAETPAELQLLREGSGPLREFLEEVGVWDPAGLVPAADEVLRLNRAVPNILLAHGNYLDARAPIPPGGTIVYCPRTHAAFGHAPHPFLGQGPAGPVRVALGTDSLASNPDLDVLGEARFIHQNHPDIAGGWLLRLATLAGAEALGWQGETGSLCPGKSADLVAVPLPAVETADPHRLVLGCSLPVAKVLFQGRWVYAGGGT